MKLKIMYILFSIFFVTSALYAADLGIGITAWYASWTIERDKTSNMDPVLYIGPSIAYQFSDKWSTTLVALATPQKYTWDADEVMELRRYDIDLALNYQISRYIKVFGGAKYLAFSYHNKTYDSDGIHHAAGPGAGISFTLPLISNVYLLANLSGLYIFGNQKDDKQTEDINFYEVGANGSLQLAYYIPSAAVTLAAGYRYQYVETFYTEDTQKNSDLEHTFKGFTFLAVKSFNL
jgi:hypothetical protein